MRKAWIGVAAIAALAYSLLLGLWLTPFVKARAFGSLPEVSAETIQNWSEAQILRERFAREIEPAKSPSFRITLDGVHPLTPLVDGVFVVSGQHAAGQDKLAFTYRVVDARVRWSHLIWALAILGGILVIIRSAREGLAFNGPIPASSSPDAVQSLQELLASEVRYCDALCNKIYRRSTLLLQAGLLTIFGGLGGLFLLPTDLPAAGSSNPWLLLTRPYGIVLLINALALVLLRQYRSLTEDYRYMVSLRWRRVNCLGAVLAAGEAGIPQVIEALLAEAYPEERLRGSSNPASPDTEMLGGTIDTLKSLLKTDEKKG